MVSYNSLICLGICILITQNVEAGSLKELLIKESEVSEKQGGGGSACLREHNEYRQKNGKPNLTGDRNLISAAKAHNDWMVDKKCFDHQCSGEPSVGDRVTNAGYKWRSYGENIAAGQGNCAAVMDTWIKSDGHRANILGNFKDVGCVSRRCNDCKYNIYWTCVFGTRQ